ncbi:MAG: hypothetical protein ACXWZP_08095 [Gaiellaceae bacterium]
MRARVVIPVLVLAGLLVAASSAAVPDTKRMVLRLSDLPARFALEQGHYADNARAAKESSTQTLADFTRWGRVIGYEADFSRDGTTGILFLSTGASTYTTVKGAGASLRDSFAVAVKPQRLNGQRVVFARVAMTGAPLGQEARTYTTNVLSQGVHVTFFVVLWRHGAVKATLLVGGPRGTLKAAEAVRLARKQQARIAAATG